MNIKYFISKQLWRVRQAQSLYASIYAGLVIAGIYISYIPMLKDLGLLGTLTFAGIVYLVFVGFGYFLDKIKMWQSDTEVLTKRNPYAYDKLTEKEIILKKYDLMMLNLDIMQIEATILALKSLGCDEKALRLMELALEDKRKLAEKIQKMIDSQRLIEP